MAGENKALSLLLVEDNDADAALFKAVLSRYERMKQAEVRRARTIAEALQALQSAPVDCVVLDLGLPDSAGLSGLWTLRAVDSNLPVVVLSGHDSDIQALAAVREGAQDYIVKDELDSVRLGRTILHSIERQQAMALLTEQQRNARYLASHDALTGLANRRHFEETTLAALLGDIHPKLALILVDLDRFKAINDSKGHAIGDGVLRTVAKRVLNCCRPNDIAARIGGDEFVLLLTSELPATAEQELLERLRNTIAQPIQLGTEQLSVSASLGVAHHPADGSTLKHLLEAADTRMYHDKARRRSQHG